MPSNQDHPDKFDEGCLEASYIQVSSKAVRYTVFADESLKIDYDVDGNPVGFELCCGGPKSPPPGRDVDMTTLTEAGRKYSRGPYNSSFGEPPSGKPAG